MYLHVYHHTHSKSFVYLHTRTRAHNQILCATERRVRRGLRSSAAFSPLLNATSTSALLPAFFSVTFTLVAVLRTTEELQSTQHISNIAPPMSRKNAYISGYLPVFLRYALRRTATHCNALQHTDNLENQQLQRTATHCNT